MNFLDYKDYNDFKKKTGMNNETAIAFLLDELGRLKRESSK